MKAILIEAAKMLELKNQPVVDEENLFSNHSLEWLRQEVERVFVVYEWGWDCGNTHFGSVKDLREVIGELQKIDAGSFAFRYPVTTKGAPSLPESFRFNLFRFAEVLEGLFPTLLGAASGVVIEYKDLVQAMGEAQEEEARYAEQDYHDDYDPGDYDPGEN